MFDQAKIGDGATYRMYTDCMACTIISVAPNKIIVQRDKATLLNGIKSGEPDALEFEPGGFCGHTSGRQRYAYAPDANGAKYTFTRRKNGRWKLAGTGMNEQGSVLSEGRNEYYDFNF